MLKNRRPGPALVWYSQFIWRSEWSNWSLDPLTPTFRTRCMQFSGHISSPPCHNRAAIMTPVRPLCQSKKGVSNYSVLLKLCAELKLKYFFWPWQLSLFVSFFICVVLLLFFSLLVSITSIFFNSAPPNSPSLPRSKYFQSMSTACPSE